MVKIKFPRKLKAAILALSVAASACATQSKPNINGVGIESTYGGEFNSYLNHQLDTLEFQINNWLSGEISREKAMKNIKDFYYNSKKVYAKLQTEGWQYKEIKKQKELSKAMLHLISIIEREYQDLFGEDIFK